MGRKRYSSNTRGSRCAKCMQIQNVVYIWNQFAEQEPLCNGLHLYILHIYSITYPHEHAHTPCGQHSIHNDQENIITCTCIIHDTYCICANCRHKIEQIKCHSKRMFTSRYTVGYSIWAPTMATTTSRMQLEWKRFWFWRTRVENIHVDWIGDRAGVQDRTAHAAREHVCPV